MKNLFKVVGALFLMHLFAGGLFAEKVIYVHGFSLINDNSACHDQTECEYWPEPAADDYAIVGYDGRRDPFAAIPSSGSVRLLQLLNKYCRADQGQTCRIVSDSMGGLTTAGVVSQYNNSGTYNILYSNQIVSAEGGSEIANLGDLGVEILTNVFGLGAIPGVDELEVSRDGIDALATARARGGFDHNRNNGVLFYHVAANRSNIFAGPWLPGEDDTLVAYHSSCGYRQIAAFNVCMGQKVRTCSWCFWQRKKLVTPWDAHFMLPGVALEGVNMGHSRTHNTAEYQLSPF